MEKNYLEDFLSEFVKIFPYCFSNQLQNQEMKEIIKELMVIEQILERSFIFSTDIESAQYYNKEISLKVNLFVNDLLMDYECEQIKEGAIEEAEVQFRQMEMKKQEYFDEQRMEVDKERDQLREKIGDFKNKSKIYEDKVREYMIEKQEMILRMEEVVKQGEKDLVKIREQEQKIRDQKSLILKMKFCLDQEKKKTFEKQKELYLLRDSIRDKESQLLQRDLKQEHLIREIQNLQKIQKKDLENFEQKLEKYEKDKIQSDYLNKESEINELKIQIKDQEFQMDQFKKNQQENLSCKISTLENEMSKLRSNDRIRVEEKEKLILHMQQYIDRLEGELKKLYLKEKQYLDLLQTRNDEKKFLMQKINRLEQRMIDNVMMSSFMSQKSKKTKHKKNASFSFRSNFPIKLFNQIKLKIFNEIQLMNKSLFNFLEFFLIILEYIFNLRNHLNSFFIEFKQAVAFI